VYAALTHARIVRYYVQLQESEKNRKLVDLLDALEFNQVSDRGVVTCGVSCRRLRTDASSQLIIFVSSVSRAVALNKLLQDCNFPSIAIHGSLKQDERYACVHVCVHVCTLVDCGVSQYRALSQVQGLPVAHHGVDQPARSWHRYRARQRRHQLRHA
jgi:hypothetical protein